MNLIVVMLILVGMIVPNLAANVIDLSVKKHALQLSYEPIAVTNQETMGMMGVHINLDIHKLSMVYLGVGGYGALTGDRGGFFTAGITPGLRIPFTRYLEADIGLFLGGGGGASAFPGDGDMIRAHAYLGRSFPLFSTWLGVARQRISKKSIKDTWVITVTKPFYITKPVMSSFDRIGSSKKVAFQKRNLRIAPLIGAYFPAKSALGRNALPLENKISLLGIDLETNRNGSALTGLFSLYAANGNKADGYGKIMTGLGYQYLITEKMMMMPYMQFGMSGGGNIDTGGGLISLAGFKGRYAVAKMLDVHGLLAQIKSYNGNFESTLLGGGVTVKLGHLDPVIDPFNEIEKTQINQSETQLKSFQWFFGNKTIYPKKSLKDKNGEAYESQIDFVAFGLEVPVNSWLNVITTTYWAYTGDVGAYAEGCFGIILKKSLFPRWTLYHQTEIGAAGGGGINVNQGTIYQSLLGIGFQQTRSYQWKGYVGWQGSFDHASFQGPIAMLSLDIKSTFLGAKN
jgi:hypothetical protein